MSLTKGTVGTVDRYQYLGVLAACLVVTLPLEWLYGARVWRRPGRLARALAVPVLFFWVVDSVAIVRGLWGYSRRYTTSWSIPHRVPVEELVFFVVVPVCAILTFETVSNLRGGKVGLMRSQWRTRAAGRVGAQRETLGEAPDRVAP